MMIPLLLIIVVTLSVFNLSAQNLVTGDHTGKFIRPAGNAVNFYLFNFMDYAAYTGGDKQINMTADGNASHFRMPNVNYRVRLGIDAALGNSRRRHGIGLSGDFRSLGGHLIGGLQASYAFQVVDKAKVQLRLGLSGGLEMLKPDLSGATYGDMIDDRYGFLYPSSDPLQNDSNILVYPRSAVGAWLRVQGFALTVNADRMIPVVTGSYTCSVRLSALTYYQIPVKAFHLMPSVSFLYDGSGYRLEGGISLYKNPEKGFYAGVFASSMKDLRLLAGYNIKGRCKLLAGVTLYFEGMARLLPIYEGFGSINANFVRYGR